MPPDETSERPLLAGEAVEIAADGAPVLIGACCEECGTRMFPASPVCCQCMSEAIAREEMPRTGTLYAFTTVQVAPKKWMVPMQVGYVDLPNGVRVFTHLAKGDYAVGETVTLTLGVVGADDKGPIRNFIFGKSGA